MSRLPPNLRPPRRAVQLSKKTFEWHKKEMPHTTLRLSSPPSQALSGFRPSLHKACASKGTPGLGDLNGVASKHLTFHARFADFSRLIAVARKRRKSKIKK